MDENKYNISTNAQNILNKYFRDKDIMCLGEILQHDGFDQYGPESDLWTFYIITKDQENNTYIIHRYYFEDWFEKCKPLKDDEFLYGCVKCTNIKDISLYDYDMLNEYRSNFIFNLNDNNDFDLDALLKKNI